MTEEALVPVEQKEVVFYEDTIVAVRVAYGGVYVPIRPLCELLGVSWTGQRRRINRDAVLSQEVRSVNVTFTEPNRTRQISMLCLRLDFISGFLFGINPDRVKSEVKGRLIRYQRECYKVLHEAFQEGRLTSDPVFEELLQTDSPAVQAYKMIMAIAKMARQQVLMEARVDNHEIRIEQLEAQLGDPGRHITPDQAMQISQAVKAIALVLTKSSGSNQFGSVYGELYRKFGITSYKLLPAYQFEEAIRFLTSWYENLTIEMPL